MEKNTDTHVLVLLSVFKFVCTRFFFLYHSCILCTNLPPSPPTPIPGTKGLVSGVKGSYCMLVVVMVCLLFLFWLFFLFLYAFIWFYSVYFCCTVVPPVCFYSVLFYLCGTVATAKKYTLGVRQCLFLQDKNTQKVKKNVFLIGQCQTMCGFSRSTSFSSNRW